MMKDTMKGKVQIDQFADEKNVCKSEFVTANIVFIIIFPIYSDANVILSMLRCLPYHSQKDALLASKTCSFSF